MTKDGTKTAFVRPSHRLMTKAEKLELGAKLHTKRDAGPQGDGDAMREQVYLPPVLANPGNAIHVELDEASNFVHTSVGGGQLGHILAHENEAPFPEALAEFFIKSLCPLGGITLDPFSGSGTTASVTARNGRLGIGFDLRRSQCELGTRRTAEQLLDVERPHQQKRNDTAVALLPGQLDLFTESA